MVFGFLSSLFGKRSAKPTASSKVNEQSKSATTKSVKRSAPKVYRLKNENTEIYKTPAAQEQSQTAKMKQRRQMTNKDPQPVPAKATEAEPTDEPEPEPLNQTQINYYWCDSYDESYSRSVRQAWPPRKHQKPPVKRPALEEKSINYESIRNDDDDDDAMDAVEDSSAAPTSMSASSTVTNSLISTASSSTSSQQQQRGSDTSSTSTTNTPLIISTTSNKDDSALEDDDILIPVEKSVQVPGARPSEMKTKTEKLKSPTSKNVTTARLDIGHSSSSRADVRSGVEARSMAPRTAMMPVRQKDVVLPKNDVPKPRPAMKESTTNVRASAAKDQRGGILKWMHRKDNKDRKKPENEQKDKTRAEKMSTLNGESESGAAEKKKNGERPTTSKKKSAKK